MWYTKCHSGSQLHVEKMARERIIADLRNLHNIILSEEEVKEKVLELLRTSSKKKQIKCDNGANIPKYKIFGILPGTSLTICLYILEYKEDLRREVKTLIDQYNMLFNKNIQKQLLNQKKKTKKRFQDKKQKKRIKR